MVEREYNKGRLKEIVEKEVNGPQLKEIVEGDGDERRLKEIVEIEEFELWLKRNLGKRTRWLKDIVERECNDRRQKTSHKENAINID